MLSFSKSLMTVACLFLANQTFAAPKEITCPTPEEIHNKTGFYDAYILDGRWALDGETTDKLWAVIFEKNLNAKNKDEALKEGKLAFDMLSINTPTHLDEWTCTYTPRGADYALYAYFARVILTTA